MIILACLISSQFYLIPVPYTHLSSMDSTILLDYEVDQSLISNELRWFIVHWPIIINNLCNLIVHSTPKTQEPKQR